MSDVLLPVTFALSLFSVFTVMSCDISGVLKFAVVSLQVGGRVNMWVSV